MRVFITGATGYIGSAVLEALVRGGLQATALARDPEKAERLRARGAATVIGELASPAAWLDALRASDAVVHTAFEGSTRGPNVDRQALGVMLPALAEGAAAAPRTFIYTSGVWVLGKTAQPADENAPVNPAAHVAWRPEHEQIVLGAGSSNGVRTIVVRPGIVYGGAQGIVSDLLKDALNGLVRVIGPGRNCWPCIYDRDLADLYLTLLKSADAGGVYHANDEGDERVNDIVEAIANHVTQRPDVRHVPIAEARKKLGTYADALALDQKVRSPRARALGWSPTLKSVTGSVARLLEEYRGSRN
jgi:nucleoside-diphosphate-sugar epimerase